MSANTRTTTSRSTARLLSRTAVVLGGQVGLAWLGSLATWSMPPTSGSVFVLAMLFCVSALGAQYWGTLADDDDPSPVLGAAVFAFTTGAFTGPTLAMHSVELGAEVVGSVCAASLAGLAAAGSVASLLTFNWRRVESWLLPALWVLIGSQVIASLFSMTSGLHQLVSLAGAVLFLFFMGIDFVLMLTLGTQGKDSWGAAVVVANNLFLDLINFVLLVLSAFKE